jgi:Flp pilus assembly protein TadD
MAVGEFRICPSCGSRNKKGWEYCARCGEDLHAVPVGDAAAPSTSPSDEVVESAEGGSWLGMIGPIVAIGLVAYAAARIHRQPPTRPDPAIFSIPEIPPKQPPAKADPMSPGQASFEEGRRLFMQGDMAGAVRALAQAVSDAPDRAEYRNAYAKALLLSDGPAAEVVRQYEEAIRLDPRVTEYVADLARALDRLGRPDEAARAYAHAVELAPDDGRILREAAALQSRAGHPENALPYLKRLAAVSPDDLVVRQELGMALEKTGDREGAKQAYQEILRQMPQAAITRGLLAEIYINEGRNDDAVGLLRAGVEADPAGAMLHRTLASALERTGHVAEAVQEYREYARLSPDAADAKAMADRAARLEARVAQSS